MKHEYCAVWNEVLLRPLHRYDLEYLRQMRNREDIGQYLRPIGQISKEQQAKWFAEYIRNEDVLFFSINFNRIQTVGSVALSDFKMDSCEIGHLMIGEANGNNLARKAFLMAMAIGKEELGCRNFTLTVNEKNDAARHIYQKIGFQQIGEHELPWGGIEWDMTISADELVLKNKEMYNIWLSREDGEMDKRCICAGGY